MPDTDDLLSDLVAIPAGEFQMGSHDGPEDERPVHSIRLGAFAIGRHQVTHRHYARFVRETGHRPPAVYELPLVVTAGGEERERAFRAGGTPYVWAELEPPEGLLDHPVNLVRWDDAAAWGATITRPRPNAARTARPTARCGSSVAAAGWRRSRGCSPAATATKCRRTRIPTASDSASPSPRSGWRERMTI